MDFYLLFFIFFILVTVLLSVNASYEFLGFNLMYFILMHINRNVLIHSNLFTYFMRVHF